jgi:H+/Cl- antiporter ClcA
MPFEVKVGYSCGFIGTYLFNLFHNIDWSSFAERIVTSGIIAVICGFLGIAGQRVYTYIERKIKNKKV